MREKEKALLLSFQIIFDHFNNLKEFRNVEKILEKFEFWDKHN